MKKAPMKKASDHDGFCEKCGSPMTTGYTDIKIVFDYKSGKPTRVGRPFARCPNAWMSGSLLVGIVYVSSSKRNVIVSSRTFA